MTLYTLATQTYDGSEINVDLYATEQQAYEALARLILPAPNQQARLIALLDRLPEDGRAVEPDTMEAFRVELDAAEWMGVVQRQVPPWPLASA